MRPCFEKALALIAASALLACAACKSGVVPAEAIFEPGRPAAAGPTNAPITTPSMSVQGRVATANSQLRYVVIEFPPGIPLPQPGQRMSVYRGAMKVGELKISSQARGANIAADITTGEAAENDIVKED